MLISPQKFQKQRPQVEAIIKKIRETGNISTSDVKNIETFLRLCLMIEKYGPEKTADILEQRLEKVHGMLRKVASV